mmetsp:Transcript_26942/g.78178  ORF Transcript_26942/g.78178 Transcript_26942/m.78178 type:complete len:321 (+) Transcript_26942:1497-2459(+)
MQNADALAQQVVIAGADHGNAAAGDFREEIRSSVECRFSALLKLEGVDMRRSLLSHPDIVAGEDVLTQIHHRGAFAHAAPVASPKAVKEVRMPVMHSHAHAAEETLVDRPESPLRRGVAFPNCALAARVNVLTEAEVTATGRGTILLVQRHEHSEHIRHLEGFPDERAHVAIQGLDIVTGRETQAVQLVARLALGLVLALPETQRELARKNFKHAQAPLPVVPPALHARLLEDTIKLVVAMGHQEILHHLPKLRLAALLQIENEVQWILRISLQQYAHGLVVPLEALGMAVCLVGEDDLCVVFGHSLLGVLSVVALDLLQ